MEDGKILLELIKELSEHFNLAGGILMLLLTLGFVFLFIYLKGMIEKASEEAAEKSRIKFENVLKTNLDAQIKLLFRNEGIRSDILSFTAKKSIEKKIEIWQKTYSLYFEYTASSILTALVFKNLIIDSLDKKYEENRKEIFINSVYLGGELTAMSITLNNSMRNYLREKIRFNDTNDIALKTRSEEVMRQHSDKVEELTNRIEKWLAENINANHTSAAYEFNDEQLARIRAQNNIKFEEIVD